MRSEERAGIVFIITLILWGTPITEPFRVFAEYLSKAFTELTSLMKLTGGGIPAIIINVTLITLATILLLLLTKTRFTSAIPVLAIQAMLVVLLLDVLKQSLFDVKTMVLNLLLLLLITLLYAFKCNKILIWIADFFVMALPVFLLNGLLLKNFGGLRFIHGRQQIEFISVFNGLFGISGIVWGIFGVLIVFLPVIYNIPGRSQ